MIDPATLARLKELLKEATPRPWSVGMRATGHPVILWPHGRRSTVATVYCSFDVELITLAVNALPALVAAVEENERLREQNEGLHRFAGKAALELGERDEQ